MMGKIDGSMPGAASPPREACPETRLKIWGSSPRRDAPEKAAAQQYLQDREDLERRPSSTTLATQNRTLTTTSRCLNSRLKINWRSRTRL